MYDRGKVMLVLAAFLCIVTFPFWYNRIQGKSTTRQGPKIVTQEKKCLESPQYMRTKHMAMLNAWKDSAVRKNKRRYTASDGKEYTMSLSNTCLKCHSNKADFCDVCHNYANAKPSCWTCHVVPEEGRR